MSQLFSVFDGAMSGINSLGSTDFFIIGGVLILLFFFGLYLGKSRLMALVLAWYPAAIIYNNLPLSSIQKFANGSAMTLLGINLVVFCILLALAYTAIARNLGFVDGFKGFFQAVQVALLAASFTDLLLVLVCRLIPIDALYHFSPGIATFFSGQYYPWLLLVPVVVAFLTSW